MSSFFPATAALCFVGLLGVAVSENCRSESSQSCPSKVLMQRDQRLSQNSIQALESNVVPAPAAAPAAAVPVGAPTAAPVPAALENELVNQKSSAEEVASTKATNADEDSTNTDDSAETEDSAAMKEDEEAPAPMKKTEDEDADTEEASTASEEEDTGASEEKVSKKSAKSKVKSSTYETVGVKPSKEEESSEEETATTEVSEGEDAAASEEGATDAAAADTSGASGPSGPKDAPFLSDAGFQSVVTLNNQGKMLKFTKRVALACGLQETSESEGVLNEIAAEHLQDDPALLDNLVKDILKSDKLQSTVKVEEGAEPPLNEQGLRATVQKHSAKAMVKFIKRVAAKNGFDTLKADGALEGVAIFYNGQKGLQSYQRLLQEMRDVAKKPKGWAFKSSTGSGDAAAEATSEAEGGETSATVEETGVKKTKKSGTASQDDGSWFSLVAKKEEAAPAEKAASAEESKPVEEAAPAEEEKPDEEPALLQAASEAESRANAAWKLRWNSALLQWR